MDRCPMFRLSLLTASFLLALFTLSAYPADAADQKTAELVPSNHGNTIYLSDSGNIAGGSETIQANGKTLARGIDYTMDYPTGTVTLLDDGLMSPGTVIDFSFSETPRSTPPPKAQSRRFSWRRAQVVPPPTFEVRFNPQPLLWNPEAGRFEPRFALLRGPGNGRTLAASNVTLSSLRVGIRADGNFTVDNRTVPRAGLESALREKLPLHLYEIVLFGPPIASPETLRHAIIAARSAQAREIQWAAAIDPRMREIIKTDGR